MADGNYELSLPDGSTMTIAPETAAKIQAYMRGQNGGGGGGGQLAQIGDAVQLGANLVEAFALRSRLDDVRSSQDRLDKARNAMDDYLDSVGSGPVQASQLKLYLADVEDAQERVDRDQNSAFGVVIDALWVQVFGAGARVADRAMNGGGSGLANLLGAGSGGGTELLVGGLAGVALVEVFNRDRGRGRRRSDR